jgi:corrinoid protein of di/trimethylamine methyltransferase
MADDELFDEMARSVVDGDDEAAAELAARAILNGVDPLAAVNEGFVPGIDEVGEAFGDGRAFLPELVMAGQAMKAAIEVLEPEMAKSGTAREELGTVVLATVQGDIHDIGKTLVGTMLTAQGFTVIDLGIDVPPATLIEIVRDAGADLVGLSAMLTTTMTAQRTTIQAFVDAGLRGDVKIMVGGAPVTQAWADDIGADAYGVDAPGAVAVARRLLGHPA